MSEAANNSSEDDVDIVGRSEVGFDTSVQLSHSQRFSPITSHVQYKRTFPHKCRNVISVQENIYTIMGENITPLFLQDNVFSFVLLFVLRDDST